MGTETIISKEFAIEGAGAGGPHVAIKQDEGHRQGGDGGYIGGGSSN